ncbi:hypothetical protein JX265_009922 [Neoarthrinium moseri]|uniref:Rhodopsin domain-containing protein n=1 Tax=Neoarthrinium moseri TaxID=1658444 RepID=A0A9Q0AL75_9PEZI|nr:uncharacterized protein JN550_008561 [Neoarthrinium moseri]KAI1843182.1 hypothetical protein JX266_010709 [Neoarthrinium moseri]KAI1860523.1 hypothetical protein JX265_009922 [Neoarthrinium moseri]KAI1865015.1 hypothetical protein JN550_008561 [Neoarthrinium moseri]
MDFSDPQVFAALPHDNRGSVVVGAVCFVLTVATVSTGMRLYTRSVIVRQLGADDYLAAIALNFYVSITLYNTGLFFTKMTFLAQYYRVLSIRKMRLTLQIAMAVVGAWSLSQVFVGIFICQPIAKFWNDSLDGHCIPNLPQWYVNAAGNIATDVAVFVLPLPVLGHLHLPKQQKLILLGIFSLGFFTVAISIIRIKYLQLFADLTYENTDSSCWSITELCSGITCACLPTLRPLVSRWLPMFASTIRRSTKDSNEKSQQLHKNLDGSGQASESSRCTYERGSGMGSQDELHRPNDVELGRTDSGDLSENIMGLKSSKSCM